jgi:hypothetical protein
MTDPNLKSLPDVFRNAQNKKKRIALRGSDAISTEDSFNDLTDRENIDFVYHY